MQGFSHIKVHILDSLISSFWSICSRWSKKLSCQGASWKQQIKNKTREEEDEKRKDYLFIYLFALRYILLKNSRNQFLAFWGFRGSFVEAERDVFVVSIVQQNYIKYDL